MDQSVGPRPVANGYTNARTNKLTLTQTQVKCFNSCQKTCKTHFAFRFLQPSCPWGRASRGSPGPCPGLGFSAAGWQSSVREEVLGITGGRDGEKDGGSAQPTAGATVASQSRRRDAGSPGGSVVGPGVVCWPHTKSRGVRAIVPGISLCREAGRRNTSPEETLWERSTVSQASWTCVLGVSHSPLPSPGLGGVSLLPSSIQETQPHPWVGVWG